MVSGIALVIIIAYSSIFQDNLFLNYPIDGNTKLVQWFYLF